MKIQKWNSAAENAVTPAIPATVKICITRCEHCGLEREGDLGGSCPRCARTFLVARFIDLRREQLSEFRRNIGNS